MGQVLRMERKKAFGSPGIGHCSCALTGRRKMLDSGELL